MIDCVVSFSGGVESTALLEYLKNKELKVVAVYSHFPQDGWYTNKNKTIQGSTVPDHLQKICDLLDVQLVVHTHQKYDIDYDQNRKYFYSTRHWILAMCNASIRFPDVKNFYWGANCGMLEFDDGLGDCSIVDPTKYQIQNVFEALQNIPRKVEGYHDENMKYFDGSYKNHIPWKTKQTISAPLIGWTKKQQWEYIREDVKKLVQSCITHNNCGVCTKCEEFKLLNV